LFRTVIKRDGSVVPYDLSKIADAIDKARLACGYTDRENSDRLAKIVEARLLRNHTGDLTIETIQDYVEMILSEFDSFKVTRAYITYRHERERIRKEREMYKYLESIRNSVIDIPDYPKKGVVFKDITPILETSHYYSQTVFEMINIIEGMQELASNKIVSPESRGFWFGCPIAVKTAKGFIPVRKPNKLPREVESVSYKTEYGVDTLSIHKDSIKNGDKVIIVDDVLATGGTVEAIIKLVRKLGGEVVGVVVLWEIESLGGRKRLEKYILSENIISLFRD